jgi:hypothetical protein
MQCPSKAFLLSMCIFKVSISMVVVKLLTEEILLLKTFEILDKKENLRFKSHSGACTTNLLTAVIGSIS